MHDDELTYSLVISEKHPLIPISVKQAYYKLSKGVLEGYKNLGIHVDYAIPKRRQKGKEKTAVCFEKLSYYEMVFNGKKISGNAQTRKKGVLLQHGSIPMSMDHTLVFDLFQFPSDKHRTRQRERFASRATTINEITNKKHTYDMLTDAFKKGFKTGLDITLKPFELTKEQWKEVHQLAETKYYVDPQSTNMPRSV